MDIAGEQAVVIINPISGTGRRHDVARRRAELAAALIEQRRVRAEVFVTERAGHGRELAQAALRRGVRLVIAWGGDGTVNEVASALVRTGASLAIVPGGSGNGLARELGVPADPPAAFDLAFTGCSRVMDAGDLDGHLFFNIAGFGIDARVAHRFAAGGRRRRGLTRYVELTARELFCFEPEALTVTTDGASMTVRPLIVAIANSRQYGNGALIAPRALIDDGRLDVVVVQDRSPWSALLQIPRLFSGELARIPGVSMTTAAAVDVASPSPLVFHVDGEPHIGGASIRARVHPGVLRVRAGSGCGTRDPGRETSIC